MGEGESREPARWQDRRACKDIPVEVFHDLAWNEQRHERLRGFQDAVTICSCCPVRAACLDYAIGLPSVEGVFGGYDPDQIRRMKRNRT